MLLDMIFKPLFFNPFFSFAEDEISGGGEGEVLEPEEEVKEEGELEEPKKEPEGEEKEGEEGKK